MLDAEIITLLRTGCAISRSNKTIACSHAHAHLKAAGMLEGAGFNILNPPPLDDGFAAYYAQVQAEVKNTDTKHSAEARERFDDLMPKRTKEADSPKEDDFFGSSQCDRKSLFPLR